MSENIKIMNKPIAENLKELFKEEGLKQKSIADKMGVTRQVVSDMMSGRRIIHPSEIIQFCELLKVSPNQLFGYSDLLEIEVLKEQGDELVASVTKDNSICADGYKVVSLWRD